MSLSRKKISVLVTAGPTRAYLDRVRYLSNYSTGQLGFEICQALEKRGFEVIAVVGPCEAPFEKLKKTKVLYVETVQEMHKAVMKVCKDSSPEFAVFSAAVLDFTPSKRESSKVSSKNSWNLKLVPTPKIIDDVNRRFPKVKKIAFKLEWKAPAMKALRAFAIKNMQDKSAEALCLNYLSDIKGKKHPAFLFTSDGKCSRAHSKKTIAQWITRFIFLSE